MAAKRKVEWTPEAVQQLGHIRSFLEQSWGVVIVQRFVLLLQEFELLAVRFPLGYPASPIHPELRMATVHKNVKVIYRVDPDRILVITLLDNRADNSGWA
ncbi:MAG: type II toxin-antitoxin system RelE/ParE family toxin [Bacteroidetes bacterium]|nr:type II toxin-antitoxin system RelE/ParE family toxin [Bacteroidota bacterium]